MPYNFWTKFVDSGHSEPSHEELCCDFLIDEKCLGSYFLKSGVLI
jgi:hypothetical protein